MKNKHVSASTALGLLMFLWLPATASSEVVQADNSGLNVRDRSGQMPTPLNQSQAPEDLRITREIRKSLTDDGSLSMNAHNIKIITVNGEVTLRGPVDSQEEKNAVDEHVRQVIDKGPVNDLLEIKTDSDRSIDTDRPISE